MAQEGTMRGRDGKERVYVAYGKDPAAMARLVLEAAKLEERIPKGGLVALKPNLVVSKPASSGATTHPEIARAAATYLREKGFSRLVIMEGSWVGDSTGKAFKASGFEALAKELGLPLVDLQEDSYSLRPDGRGGRIAICDAALEADFILNLPVIKGHCQTLVTCALKNMKGCIPDDEKSRFHELGLHEPIARLNAALKSGFTLADGICGDLDFEEGGNPVPMGIVAGSWDPVLLDSYVCRLLGHRIEDVPYIGLAESYGIGSSNLRAAEVVELGDKEEAAAAPPPSGKVRALAARVDEKAACSACYAALIHGLARVQEGGGLGVLDRRLAALGGKIRIGRGFRRDPENAATPGIGFGACARGAGLWVEGCPPDGGAAADFLESLIEE